MKIVITGNPRDIAYAKKHEKNIKCSVALCSTDTLCEYCSVPASVEIEYVVERWRAKRNESYWCVGDDCCLVLKGRSVSKARDEGHALDNGRWKLGNYFETQEQADTCAKEILEVYRRHAEGVAE